MTEIKRTIETPPSSLQKKVLEFSVSQNWDDAIKEWEMKNYFYVSEYKPCLCSPREICNITVMINKINSNEIDICNSCAERYFNCSKNKRIEYYVRRIMSNIEYTMDKITLGYLLENKIIDTYEQISYDTIRGMREGYALLHRKTTNKKLLLFTDYQNKDIFDKIDRILAWSVEQFPPNIDNIINIRNVFLATGKINIDELDHLIVQRCIGVYNIEAIKSAKQLLDKKLKHIELYMLPPKYDKRRPRFEWPKKGVDSDWAIRVSSYARKEYEVSKVLDELIGPNIGDIEFCEKAFTMKEPRILRLMKESTKHKFYKSIKCWIEDLFLDASIDYKVDAIGDSRLIDLYHSQFYIADIYKLFDLFEFRGFGSLILSLAMTTDDKEILVNRIVELKKVLEEDNVEILRFMSDVFRLACYFGKQNGSVK